MPHTIDILQGIWKVTSLEIDGTSLPDAMLSGAKISIEGNRFETVAMGSTYAGIFSVNETASPKTIDMKFTVGPEKGNTSLGILEVEGDKWKLCLTITSKDRPATFATSPGSGLALENLERMKARELARDNAAQQSTAAKKGEATDDWPSIPELEGEWEMVEGIRDGQPMDKRMVSTGRRIAKGNSVSILFGGQALFEANYVVDRQTTPNQMTYYHTGGMFAGLTQLGIYEYDGKLLKIALAAPGNDRPEAFVSQVGDSRTVATWKKK